MTAIRAFADEARHSRRLLPLPVREGAGGRCRPSRLVCLVWFGVSLAFSYCRGTGGAVCAVCGDGDSRRGGGGGRRARLWVAMAMGEGFRDGAARVQCRRQRCSSGTGGSRGRITHDEGAVERPNPHRPGRPASPSGKGEDGTRTAALLVLGIVVLALVGLVAAMQRPITMAIPPASATFDHASIDWNAGERASGRHGVPVDEGTSPR